MKLDYATLISPYPLFFEKIGHVKSPTLKEIWEPEITYNRYNTFLSLLLVQVENYCEKVNPQLSDWFNSLSDEEKIKSNMFDVISKDKGLQEQYRELFEFFFVENIEWNEYLHAYITYVNRDENNLIFPIGIISKENWNELCDIILQLNNVSKKDNIEQIKFKSKLAQEVWELTHSKEQKEKQNKDMALPNIISSVAAKEESLNMINIWDLTVYQLYNQFQKQQENAYYEISAMSVAAWGDKKGKFDGGAWYKNIYET